MIIHSYFTEGYFEWAKLFVQSLAKSNGYGLRLFLSTRNLDDKRIDKLHDLYHDVIVMNEDLDYDQMAKRAKVDKKTLLKYKNRVESVKVDKESKVWKLMIAAEDRLKEIKQLLDMYQEPMLHVDIDTYVKKDITPIVETVKANDFTTRWRIEKQIKREGYVRYENRATLISVQGYNGSENSRKFLDRWIYHLCKVPAHKRETGFGQTSCYYAYLDLKDEVKFGDVPPSFLSPQGHGQGILWGANKGAKQDTLREYQNDLKKR
jgi:hypothetical protein